MQQLDKKGQHIVLLVLMTVALVGLVIYTFYTSSSNIVSAFRNPSMVPGLYVKADIIKANVSNVFDNVVNEAYNEIKNSLPKDEQTKAKVLEKINSDSEQFRNTVFIKFVQNFDLAKLKQDIETEGVTMSLNQNNFQVFFGNGIIKIVNKEVEVAYTKTKTTSNDLDLFVKYTFDISHEADLDKIV